MARSKGGVSNSDEQPNLAISFASTKENHASKLPNVDNLDEVLDALSDWEDQLRDVNFDDLEARL